jgi:TPR repeat protein
MRGMTIAARSAFGVHPSGCRSISGTLKRGHRTPGHATRALLQTIWWVAMVACLSLADELPAQEASEPPQPPLEAVMAAAFEGDPLAQLAIAIVYEERESFTNAVRWLNRAAETGLAEAQFKLAYAHTVGRGAPKDLAAAVSWYRRAAEQDHAEAQYNLAVCYEKGLGIERDLQAAFQWHTKAALLGDDFAQKALGVCCEKGRGVAADAVEAWKWYSVAAERGNSEALKLRELLASRLTKEQLAEGRGRYSEFVARAPVSVTAPLASKPDKPRQRTVDFLE